MRAVSALQHCPAGASSPGYSPRWCFGKVNLIQLSSHPEQTAALAASLAFLGSNLLGWYCHSFYQADTNSLYGCSEPEKCKPALAEVLVGDSSDQAVAELPRPAVLGIMGPHLDGTQRHCGLAVSV